MSAWQFNQAVEGWIDAHNPKPGNRLSDEEKGKLFDWLEQSGTGERVLSTQRWSFGAGGKLVAVGRVTFTAG